MKKYLLGLFAIALAVGFSAFTKPLTTDYYFAFSATGDTFDDQEVEDESLWAFVGNSPSGCSGSNESCEIKVDPVYVDDPLGSPTLDPAAIIKATGSALNGYHVDVTQSTGILQDLPKN